MVDHTSLPPELWLEVFRWATYVPRVRRLEPVDAFQPQHATGWAYGVNTPVSSMQVKCVLVLVCRAWHSLATELLYEHVIISSKRTALLLSSAIEDSEQRAHEAVNAGSQLATQAQSSHARWIRHVGIHTRTRSSARRTFWQAVVTVVSRCPNVQLLSVIFHHAPPWGVSDWFKYRFGNTLKGLCWEQRIISENQAFGDLGLLSTSFLHAFPGLRVLDFSKLSIERREPGELSTERSVTHEQQNGKAGTNANPDTRICLPSLVVLIIPACGSILRFASTFDLPSLQRLIVHPASPDPELPMALETFLRRHGPSITTLEVCSSGADKTMRTADVTDFLQPGMCPNLDTLVYDACETGIAFDPAIALSKYTAHDGPPPGDTSAPLPDPDALVRDSKTNGGSPFRTFLSVPHPTLRRIALRSFPLAHLYPPSRCPHASHSHATHTRSHGHLCKLLSALSDEPNLLPGLETIRLTDTLQEACLDWRVGCQLLAWWVGRMESVGVDLQDGEGVVWMFEDGSAEPQPEEGKEKGG